MFELIQYTIQFVWSVINMPIALSPTVTITIFGGFSFTVVAALFYKIIFGGGGENDK